jgi:hypothetical protein
VCGENLPTAAAAAAIIGSADPAHERRGRFRLSGAAGALFEASCLPPLAVRYSFPERESNYIKR